MTTSSFPYLQTEDSTSWMYDPEEAQQEALCILQSMKAAEYTEE